MAKGFPSGFFWGAATSAHQVEGGNHNDWSEWEKLGLVKNKEQSGRAVDHYHRYKEDFALVKELGHNAHRFSIEWSRIEPHRGKFDQAAIDHYREVLEELHRLGIEPIVTLHHFTNPVWVAKQGAWANKQSVDDFGRYVKKVVQEFSGLVKYWVTINEPTVIVSLGYLSDFWPPQRKNPAEAWGTIRNLVKAHQLAYQIIHRRQPEAMVGVANNLINFTTARTRHLGDSLLVKIAHQQYNRWWLRQTLATQDFIGLNYYFRHPLRLKASLRLEDIFKPDPGWETSPDGMAQIIQWLATFRRPIIITENGLPDATDERRAKFIRDHVDVLARAIADGVDIRGYVHWSLIDNFEWRDGFDPRFGLIAVDYTTMKRTLRPSAHEYKKIIQE